MAIVSQCTSAKIWERTLQAGGGCRVGACLAWWVCSRGVTPLGQRTLEVVQAKLARFVRYDDL